MWCSLAFAYYLIVFQLKYLPGDVFNNSMASSGAELLGNVAGGVLLSKLGIRFAFSSTFIVSTFGGLLILFFGISNPNLMPLFMAFVKFGVASGFVIVYVSTVDLFPTLFCATALGFCNFFARLVTIMAPVVAEKSGLLPIIVFTCMSVAGSMLSLLLRPPNKIVRSNKL